jgi:hypothetical protein
MEFLKLLSRPVAIIAGQAVSRVIISTRRRSFFGRPLSEKAKYRAANGLESGKISRNPTQNDFPLA